jgi:gamma-glutamyltranspeptidase/glutathione hydrolase
VVEPFSTGVGGDVFALVWSARAGKVYALNASGRAAAAADAESLRAQGYGGIPDDSGYAVTVPGAVSGWQALLGRFGNMDMAEALRPAIEYAEAGYPVSEMVALQWAGAEARLKQHYGGEELLLRGCAPRAGEVMTIRTLADTLRSIAYGGADAFYKGRIAERIAAFVQERGGWLTTEDMAEHAPSWEEPISTRYRGVDIWQCPPNNQGVNVLLGLNIAEGFDIGAMGAQSANRHHHLIECARLALTDGMYHITDPTQMRIDTGRLISKRYAAARRRFIREAHAMDNVPLGVKPEDGDTVYITCVDGEGNACSLINSVFSDFGTGLVVPGTGIALHSRGASFSLDPGHPNVLAPKKLPFHTLIPGIATRNDELWLSYGVMGTVQQAQGQIQVLSNMIDFGMSPQEALDAPRFSYRPLEGEVGLEPRIPFGVAEELRARGHRIVIRESHPLYFGGGQVIARDAETGALTGGSEPRNDGCAVGW